MSARNWFVLMLAALVAAGTVSAGDVQVNRRDAFQVPGSAGSQDELDEIVWFENFEGPDVEDQWTYNNSEIQPVYWQQDEWMPYDGTNSWRCFRMGIGSQVFGGYDNDWLQLMMTPLLDVSGASSLDLSFRFRINCEIGNWDGGNVWVMYGDSPDNLSQAVATPVSPDYTEDDLNAFDLWGFSNIPGWAGQGEYDFNENYTEATFDFSEYTGNDYFHVIFAFSSDAGLSSASDSGMFGYQIDAIDLTADGETIWADDADGNNIGGEPTFLTGINAAGGEPTPQQWAITDGPGQPYSGEFYMGIDQYTRDWEQYMEGPEFDLPALEPGEELWLDVFFNNDYEDDQGWPPQERFYWTMQVFNPFTGGWDYASNVGGWSGTNYVYVGSNTGVWEPFSTSGYTYDWTLDEIAGAEGVRVRAMFYSPNVQHDFSHHRLDDIVVKKTALEYDISTQLVMPYPTTVGVPVYGKVNFSNLGPNDANGWLGTWSPGGPVYPLYPQGPYDLPAGETLQVHINDPGDPEHEGYWVPASINESMAVTASHTFVQDEIPDNNTFTATIAVMEEGLYEVGMDSRGYYGTLSSTDQNDGPVVHLDPVEVNPGIYGEYFDEYDIQQLRMYGFFHDAAGGAGADPSMMFHVYEGGDTPGAEIWSGEYSFGVNEGFTGDVMAVMDVSDVPELQDLTTDFYVWCEITDFGGDGGTSGYVQPFIYRTKPIEQWQPNQFFTWEDANNGENLTEFGHHVSVVLAADPASVEPVASAGVPDEFALASAYPNPFNPTTTLRFDVPRAGHVSLIAYNVIGRQIARIADREFTAGSYTAVFDASALASGVYFIRMEAPGFSAVRKAMLMR